MNGGAGDVCVCDDRQVMRILPPFPSPPTRLPDPEFYTRRALGDEACFGVVHVQGILRRSEEERLKAFQEFQGRWEQARDKEEPFIFALENVSHHRGG